MLSTPRILTVTLRGFPLAAECGFFLLLSLVIQLPRKADVFLGNLITFIDADCFSRMTRVQLLVPPQSIRWHAFENHPQGVWTHTTAPLDYLILGLGGLLRPFSAQPVDLAGALISPILGALFLFFLWTWMVREKLPWRRCSLLLACVSPVFLVHGFSIGRPDHQSLLILLLGVAICAEISCFRASVPGLNRQRPPADSPVRTAAQGWALAAGVAWGLALWTSLFEPLILFTLMLALRLTLLRPAKPGLRCRGDAATAVLFIAAIAWDGWRFSLPSPEVVAAFKNWSRSIAELRPAPPWGASMLAWAGVLPIVVFPMLIWNARKSREAAAMLILLAVTYGLTVWQERWGYFMLLSLVLSIPFALTSLRWKWLAAIVFFGSLFPLLTAWDTILFPPPSVQLQIAEKKKDALLLHDAASRLKAPEVLPLMAPWWLSPAIAYWSGQPCVGGSSHQSLPGTVASSEFYMTDDEQEALQILRTRGVRYVVGYEPERVLLASQTVLNRPAPPGSMANRLFDPRSRPPRFLRLFYSNEFVKIYEVDESYPHGG